MTYQDWQTQVERCWQRMTRLSARMMPDYDAYNAYNGEYGPEDVRAVARRLAYSVGYDDATISQCIRRTAR